jgi:hypothetical protein
MLQAGRNYGRLTQNMLSKKAAAKKFKKISTKEPKKDGECFSYITSSKNLSLLGQVMFLIYLATAREKAPSVFFSHRIPIFIVVLMKNQGQNSVFVDGEMIYIEKIQGLTTPYCPHSLLCLCPY